MSQAFVINTFFDEEGSVENFLHLLDKATQHPETKALFVLAGDKNGFTTDNLNAHLKALQIPIGGAIFPQIIYQKQHYAKGTVMCVLSEPLDIYNVHNFVDYQKDDSFLPECKWLSQAQSMIVLIDGMGGNSEPFIESLYNHLGSNVPIAGGLAGSESFQSKPCILSNEGLLFNAAQLINFPRQLHIGVKHGWQPIAGPFLVTQAEGNKLISLNYEPAFQVYRRTIESFDKGIFENKSFFTVTNEFSLGFERSNDELLARSTYYVEEGDILVCPGGIPQNALAYVLRGDANNLIQAASKATHEAIEQINNQPIDFALNFNCIGRYLFLGEGFLNELSNIEAELPPHTSILGALTLGEIASLNNCNVQLFNTTAVVALLTPPKSITTA